MGNDIKELCAPAEPVEEQHAKNHEPLDKIKDWCESVKGFEAVPWDRMPEIDLYMDQVLTYMDKQLRLFKRNENSKMLTSSMINNYVKDSLLPRPEHKKYGKDHLAILMVIYMLKQVLSIPDIATLTQTLLRDTTVERMHELFCEEQKAALSSVCSRVRDTLNDGEIPLRHLAMTLALEANARRIAAERILCELSSSQAEKGGAKK